MRIAIAQINSTVGDFPGNRKKILDFAWKAKTEEQADLVLFPELALCGSPPLDLLRQKLFADLNIESLRYLQDNLPEDLAVGLGYVKRSPYSGSEKLLNMYGVIHNRDLVFEQAKFALKEGGYFDETRYFESGRNLGVFDYQGERIGFVINEDIWQKSASGEKLREKLRHSALSFVCVPCASPYTMGCFNDRLDQAAYVSQALDVPVIVINAAGANDSVIFDGRSFMTRPGAAGPVFCAAAFAQDLVVRESREETPQTTKAAKSAANELDLLEDALVLGIRDYMKKCGFKTIHFGLSGGIDSALVAYLAAKAAGPENVVCFNMPSRFSSQGSKDDSRELAENLGCRYEVLPIEPVFKAFLSTLEGVFEKRPFDVAEENIQARIRGVLWMAYANKFNSMLLAAGNKSEIAMGYCTLYGDTNGALAPIGDIFKTEVFALCRRINERAAAQTGKPVIPPAIIDKPPSAELRPNQKDQDSLPPYEVLDEILAYLLRDNLSPADIAAKTGHSAELVNKVARTVARAEWKRRQLPPVLKVSAYPFGIDRNMPLSRALFEL